MGGPVHIFHQLGKAFKARVIAPRIEMRRAVPVRITHGKGVGSELVDASHQHVAGQPFHQAVAFRPAVIAEDFTQGAAFFILLDMGCGAAQLSQTIMEELTVSVPRNPLMHRLCKARHDLVVDHIYAGHMLTFHFPEIVADAAGHPGVGVVILNDMSDIFHPMVGTPLSQLPGKACFHKLCHLIHVLGTHPGRTVSGIIPQSGQAKQEFLSPPCAQRLLQLAAPGKLSVLLPQSVVKGITVHISQLRFIGKEACYGVPEVFPVMLIMLFINLIDQHPYGIRIDQVHIILPAAAPAGGEQHEQTVSSLGQVKVDKSVLIPVCQVYDPFPADRQALSVRLGNRQDAQKLPVRLQEVLHQNGSASAGSHDIHMALRQIYLLFVRMFQKSSVGMSCGKFIVVQNPYLHTAFSGLIHDKIQVLPPAGPAEIRMRPRLQTDFPDSALLYFIQFLPDRHIVFALHPQKGKDMTRPFPPKQRLHSFHSSTCLSL